ncbi:unnamed protein product [Orchesella dallaii]|uniref:Uncharacterized protein n=1 Tax=Orchesella dallaii TaxID=48710 RepID=A0ABP1QKW4_9HEXA
MRHWIVSKQQDPTLSTNDHLKLLAISNEVEVDPIGMSCHFFTLSYHVLGSVRLSIAIWKYVSLRDLRYASRFFTALSANYTFFSLLFAFGQVFVTLNLMKYCLKELEKALDNMIIIFDVVTMTMVSVNAWIIMYILWFKGDKLQAFVNEINLLSSPMSSSIGYLSYLASYSIILTDAWSTKWNDGMVEAASSQITNIIMFPIDFMQQSFQLRPVVKQCSWLVAFILETRYGFPEMIYLSFVFTMWNATTSFRGKLQPEVTLEQGLKLYRDQKNLWISANDLFGFLFLCMYIANISYYSQLQDKLSKWNQIISWMFILENVLIFGLGSHINYEARKVIRHWIVSKQQEPTLSTNEQLRLLAISDEVEGEPFGITCCFFTLSYKLLGSTLITCFLFTIVLVCFLYYSGRNAIRALIMVLTSVFQHTLLPCLSENLRNSTAPLENVVNYGFYVVLWPALGCFCMPEFVALSIVLSLWELAKSFQGALNKITSFPEGYSLYKTYRKLFNDINDLWSPTFLILYIGSVAYYGKAPFVFLNHQPALSFIFFFVENVIIWGLGSHVHKMVFYDLYGETMGTKYARTTPVNREPYAPLVTVS